MRYRPLALLTSFLIGCASEPDPDPAIAETNLAPIPVAACTDGSDCAEGIPMTGTAYPGMRELDIAMRQWMKFRCVGAGTLAVSLNGRRIYKRGFGLKYGPAMSNNPGCNTGAGDPIDPPLYYAPVQPDTPIPIGSVSKLVTAARVRELVWNRVVARGKDNLYSDATEVLLLDDDLDLLPQRLMRAFRGTDCGEVVVTDVSPCTRACGSSGADVRWLNVTIGDLIAHTAGLPNSAPNWSSWVMGNVDDLRDYDSEADWQAEHQSLRTRHPEFADSIDWLQDYLHDSLNLTAQETVYFINRYHFLDGENPIDEWMKVIAGRCLARNPGGSTDTLGTIGPSPYTNTGFAILDRVVSHLWTTDTYGAETGFPETHAGSAMDHFLREIVGVSGGVESEEGWLHWQRVNNIPGYQDPVPLGRTWSANQASVYPTSADLKRPYCIWNDALQTCRIDTWIGSSNKPAWDFSDVSPVLAILGDDPALNIGQGAIATEAPVLLRMINRYAVGDNDVRQGRPRATCGAACDDDQLKSGALGGGYAQAVTLIDKTTSISLPRRDANGRLTNAFDQMSDASIDEKGGVDFVVALNQNDDKNCDADNCNYNRLQAFVRHGLSRVIWPDVEHHLATEKLRIADIAMNAAGNTYYWYENDVRKVRTGNPVQHHDVFDNIGSDDYRLPSTRTGADIVGVGIAPGDHVYAWYTDGRVSSGSSTNLGGTAQEFTLPLGKQTTDIVGIDVASTGLVYTWYRDKTRSVGTPTDLDANGIAPYTLPAGRTVDDIAGIAIAHGASDAVFVRYHDGGVNKGTSTNLGADTRRGPLYAGMTISALGDTVVWFHTGYVETWDGNPRQNVGASRDVIFRGWVELPEGKTFGDIRGISKTIFNGALAFFAGGARAGSGDAIRFNNSAGAQTTVLAGKSWDDVLGIDTSNSGDVYSWYRGGKRAVGTAIDLDATSNGDFVTSAGYQAADVVAIAIHPGDMRVYAIYSDGAASSGRSWDIGENGTTHP